MQRRENLSARDAVYKAALMRFRPILMTTMGAILGALPLAIGLGEGSELRQPLGISIVGGLFLSQILTLYTTPVVFIYLDRFGTGASYCGTGCITACAAARRGAAGAGGIDHMVRRHCRRTI